MRLTLIFILLSVILNSCKFDAGSKMDKTNSVTKESNGNDTWYNRYADINYASLSDSCLTGNIDDSFKELLYNFDFIGFNSQEIIKYFNENTLIDSIRKEDSPGYTYYLFRFSDSLSSLDFLVKSFNEKESFYLDRGLIESNLFSFRNGLKIGQDRADVFNRLNLSIAECDTFRFSDGELSTDYDFLFKEDTLIKIIIWGTE